MFNNGDQTLEVLRDISLTIKEGETVGILGVSGAGKSTLLHILATLDEPTSGIVFWKGKDVFSLKEGERDRLRRNRMGFIFQFYHLLPEFSVLENVLVPSRLSGQGRGKKEVEGKEILSWLGLKERIHFRPGRLSGGERQRAAIARALINDPEVIFADEPTGNLDRKNKEIIEETLFTKINRNGKKALLLVTHEKALADKAQRVFILDDGVLKETKKKEG